MNTRPAPAELPFPASDGGGDLSDEARLLVLEEERADDKADREQLHQRGRGPARGRRGSVRVYHDTVAKPEERGEGPVDLSPEQERLNRAGLEAAHTALHGVEPPSRRRLEVNDQPDRPRPPRPPLTRDERRKLFEVARSLSIETGVPHGVGDIYGDGIDAVYPIYPQKK